MNYFFLKKDFTVLQERIVELSEKIKAAGREAGESCSQSSETWHDNFGLEEAQRQQATLSKALRDLLAIKNDARLIVPQKKHVESLVVAIGRNIMIRNVDTKEIKSFVIGSYMVLDQTSSNEVSYNAPLISPFMGAIKGEHRELLLHGEKLEFEILEVT